MATQQSPDHTSIQGIVQQMKGVLDRVAAAKNNPNEVQQAVDEGRKTLENVSSQSSQR